MTYDSDKSSALFFVSVPRKKGEMIQTNPKNYLSISMPKTTLLRQ